MSEKTFSSSALRAAEAHFGFQFPPDAFELLQKQPIPNGYDWENDNERIRNMLAWPLDGLLFDVENNGFWWPEWGKRAATKEDRTAIVTEAVSKAPKLIPLMAHRYIPEVPDAAGNPVFSVYQSDIIVYGADLDDWLRVESDSTFQSQPKCSVREIEFWSLMVERNGDPQFTALPY